MKGEELAEIRYESALHQVYSVARTGNTIEAIELIVDPATKRLRPIFQYDGNHSWYIVGDYYWKLGMIKDARSAFLKSLRSGKGDIQAMWALGNCYSALRKHHLAAKYFQRALGIEPENMDIRFNFANALFDQGKFEDAIEHYEFVCKSGMGPIKKARININLAQSNLRKSVPKKD
jgi:tetratricopeptide (TPR) repeat protein